MNRFALLALYRSLTRHKLYAALNIGGLAIGIAVFLVLALYVRFETSFEKWLPRHEEIYIVQTVWNLPGGSANGAFPDTMGGLFDQLREDFPDLVGTRIRGGKEAGSVLRGGVATQEDVAQVDPSFFKVFDLPMVMGEGAAALGRPTNVLLSQSAAKKYFGTADPIGQTMTISMDAPAGYQVAGIFRDLPKNSDLKLSILMPLPRTPPHQYWYHWGSTSLATYLRFDTEAAARDFQGKLPAFVNRRALNDLGKDAWKIHQLSLLPLTRNHLEPVGAQSASRKLTVAAMGLVGVLTLLIAVVNYVNLATARAGLRAREVAMRKVLGADRPALLRQFLGEAILMVAVAAFVGLILVEFSLPLVNAAAGLSLAIPYTLTLLALFALSVLVGVVAGLYPAVLLSRFPAATVLAPARAPGGGRSGARTREVLVLFQFALAITFMIGAAVLVAQTRHVRNTDLGFQREGLLVVRSLRDSAVSAAQKRAFAIALRGVPGVQAVSLGNSAVGGTGEKNSENMPLPGVAGPGPQLQWAIVGPKFFETYGARLIAGRLFDEVHGADDSRKLQAGQVTNIVINRRAVETLGFRSPQEAVGKTIGGRNPRTVIGVTDDVRFFSPREPIAATYFKFFRDPEEASSAVASVRFEGDPRPLMEAVRDLWRRMIPQVPFDGATADTKLEEYYQADDRATRLFGIGAALAVVIGCVGLWGLASFNTERRVKEIGIRKTLGASSWDIVQLLVGQFLRPVLVANLFAWPMAYFATRIWLAGFDDSISLSPWFFVGASATAVLIAVLTVLGQSLRASRAAPAWALRHD